MVTGERAETIGFPFFLPSLSTKHLPSLPSRREGRLFPRRDHSVIQPLDLFGYDCSDRILQDSTTPSFPKRRLVIRVETDNNCLTVVCETRADKQLVRDLLWRTTAPVSSTLCTLLLLLWYKLSTPLFNRPAVSELWRFFPLLVRGEVDRLMHVLGSFSVSALEKKLTIKWKKKRKTIGIHVYILLVRWHSQALAYSLLLLSPESDALKDLIVHQLTDDHPKVLHLMYRLSELKNNALQSAWHVLPGMEAISALGRGISPEITQKQHYLWADLIPEHKPLAVFQRI